MSKRLPSVERWAPAPGNPGVEVSSRGQVRGPSGLLATQRLGRQTVVFIDGKPVALAMLVERAFAAVEKPKRRKRRDP